MADEKTRTPQKDQRVGEPEVGDETPASTALEADEDEATEDDATEDDATEDEATEDDATEDGRSSDAAAMAGDEPGAETPEAAPDEEPAETPGPGEGRRAPGEQERAADEPAEQADAAQDEAATKAPQAPPLESDSPGRDRLVAALRRPTSRGQLIAAILLAIVGFASVVQVQSTEADDDYEGARQEDLVQLLNSLAAASQRAENEIAQLEQTRNSLRNDTKSRQTALEQARQLANVYGILAGTLPAVGPGVVVTVQDPNNAVGTDQLLNGVEELRDAGAEAIEINDSVRVVAQTSLADGENGVVVDGQQLSPPYTIEAIGDSHTLAQALDFTGGFVDVIEGETVGGNVVVKQVSSVEIATLHEPEEPEYAEPAESE